MQPATPPDDRTTTSQEERPQERPDEDEGAAAYRAVLAGSLDAYVSIDARGLVTDWNPAAETLFGWLAHEARGRSLSELVIPSQYRAAHDAAVRARVGAGSSRAAVRQEFEALHRDGSTFPVEVSIIEVPGTQGPTFRGFVRDLTDARRRAGELARQAVTDPLTGLANRSLLLHRLTDLLDRPDGAGVGVLFLDVDRFKVVNDSLGHSTGDRLLQAVAGRLRRGASEADLVARFGGDEFVLLMRGRTSACLQDQADALLAGLRAPMDVDGRQLVVDVSIGIATARPGVGAEQLLADADAAMYLAKQRSGGRSEVFSDELRARAVIRLDLERELRDAVRAGELDVHYQPVVTTAGTMVGVEALVRWPHPTRGFIPPSEFIPVAEETGLVVELGHLVLEHAARHVRRWRELPGHEELVVAVNVSARQLVEPGFADRVQAVLAGHGLPAAALCVEITESILTEEHGPGADCLRRLHGYGVLLAVDDFGTGYSSLLSLRRFPAQVLKVDRFFVAGLGRNLSDDAIVRSVISLAHSLGLSAIAEGVESAEQLELLRHMGCDQVQGYHIARPGPAGDIEALLRRDGPVVPDRTSAAPPPMSAPPRSPVRRSARTRLRTLLVDDSPGDRNLLRLLLEGEDDFEVAGEAADGETAAELARALAPDLVLLDLAMPGLDGLATLRLLREHVPACRVVVLSAYTSAAAMQDALRLGASGCVDKGVPGERLLGELRRLAGEAAEPLAIS